MFSIDQIKGPLSSALSQKEAKCGFFRSLFKEIIHTSTPWHMTVIESGITVVKCVGCKWVIM